MLLPLIYNTALLLALTALYEINHRLWESCSWAKRVSTGAVFGVITIVGMLHPVPLAEGVFMDGRTVVLGVSGLHGGPLTALTAGLLAGAYRIWLGGAGTTVGIVSIVIAVSGSLALRLLIRREWVRPGGLTFMNYGLVLHLLCLVDWLLLLPAGMLPGLITAATLPFILVLAPSTALLALLLQNLETQHHVRRALARSEVLWNAITHALPDRLVVLTEEGRYVNVLSPGESRRGTSDETWVGKTLEDIFEPQEAQQLRHFLQLALSTDAPPRLEYTLRGPNGTQVMEGRAQRLDMDWEGQATALVISRDISERVQAENERRIAAVAFESHQPMLITDAQTVILRVNQALLRLLGYTREDLLGQKVNILRSGRQSNEFYQTMWRNILSVGQWEGEIWDRRKDNSVVPLWFTITAVRDAQGNITHFVATLSDLTERKAQEEQMRNIAYYDALTSLPNRRLLLDRLQRAISGAQRSEKFGALLFLDLDRFKQINDTLGHAAGDQLLQETATRISRALRASDTVARLGGDEFVVVLENLSTEADEAQQQACTLAQQILDTLAQPYDLHGQICHTSGSLGLTLISPMEPQQDLDRLMHEADQAMYEAKRAGRNRLHCHTDSNGAQLPLQ
jgi:diguanylate cyclase (GGDEF)-like protein/PAS domain S-box-containing protein